MLLWHCGMTWVSVQQVRVHLALHRGPIDTSKVDVGCNDVLATKLEVIIR